MAASRGERQRLDKFLSDPDYGPALVRLPKKDQRRVLDLLEDGNRSRNRIKDAQKELDKIQAERKTRRLGTRTSKINRLATRLRRIWGKNKAGRWKADLGIIKINMTVASDKDLDDIAAMSDAQIRGEVMNPRWKRDTTEMYPESTWGYVKYIPDKDKESEYFHLLFYHNSAAD